MTESEPRTKSQAVTETVTSAPAEFTWRAHPARQHPGKALAVGAVILALSGASVLLMQSPWWGLIAAGVLLVTLNRFYFPSRFRIDGEGITAQYPLRRQRIRWSDLRRFVHDSRGGYLSTRARRSFLDAYSGMHILFGGERESVIGRVRAAMASGAAA